MLKYIGGGFLRGVPARDLKDDEVRRFGFSYLVRSGLYVPMNIAEVKGLNVVVRKPARKSKRIKENNNGRN